MREEQPTPKDEHPKPEPSAAQPDPEQTDQDTGAGPAEQPAAGETEQSNTLRVYEEDVVEALKNVYDPEIPINVYELGLIYGVSVDESNNVYVEMTLTTPNCPEAENIPPKARGMIKKMVPGVSNVEINLVWEPAWTMEMMSEDAKLALGLF
jgi:FeS assembly SUF system protein